VKNTHHRGTEFAEIGEFFNQELFTPRSEPVLSGVEGRLRGAISESCVTGKPEDPTFRGLLGESKIQNRKSKIGKKEEMLWDG
jgi:hypothetical protein